MNWDPTHDYDVWCRDNPEEPIDSPDPEPDEPDFFVTHSCGHQFGYWQHHQPSADQPCPICQPCPGCGKKAFACECPFVDPFAHE